MIDLSKVTLPVPNFSHVSHKAYQPIQDKILPFSRIRINMIVYAQ